MTQPLVSIVRSETPPMSSRLSLPTPSDAVNDTAPVVMMLSAVLSVASLMAPVAAIKSTAPALTLIVPINMSPVSLVSEKLRSSCDTLTLTTSRSAPSSVTVKVSFALSIIV